MAFDPPLSPSEVQHALDGKFGHIAELDGGGQGTVFTAQMRGEGGAPAQKVALKLYFPDQHEQRAAREVKALGKLSCPSLVALADSGTTKIRRRDCLFVATEFIAGQALHQRLQAGPLSVPEAAALGHDVAQAIAALWAERIVHRDLKPPNILLRANGRAVVIDLGVARHIDLPAITAPGQTWGTIGYMSPEQSRFVRQLSCKSDVFSLGIVLQCCLAGSHPSGGSQQALARGGIPTASLIPNLPPPLSTTIDSMLRLAPHLRPDPMQVATQLQAFA